LTYYTNYIRYLLHNSLNDVPVILWKNFDQLLYSIGSMVLPRVYESLPMKILTQVIAVAVIAGTARLFRRGIGTGYALFALVSVAILLICNFPSTERYVVPLYPLLLAGFATELEHMGQMFKAAFRHKDFSQRAVAFAFSGALAMVVLAAISLQLFMTFAFLQSSVDQKLAKLRDQEAAYTWISKNLPESAKIFSYQDPLLYLYTGRRGIHSPIDPLWWYREDHASIQSVYRDLPAYCRSRGLDYVYFTTEDLGRESGDDDQREVQALIRTNPELKPVFTAGIGTVYKVDAQHRDNAFLPGSR
jgi:hypothetical protein